MSHRALGTLALALAFAVPAAASLPEKEFTKTLPLVNGRVSVEAYKGSITVRTWDRAEVSVKARVVADDSCSDDQKKRVERTEVVAETTSSGVAIRADYDRVKDEEHQHWFHWGCNALPFVHFEISMPRSAPLKVKDYKSRIDVAGLEGDLTLDTYKGRVEIDGLGGALDLTTYKGEVHAATAMRKDTRVETYKGEVTISVPKEAAFRLEDEAGRRGRVRAELASSRTGSGPLLRLSTHKGDIRVVAR